MTLYSFKGHYPVEQTDNNKGWYEVPAKPEAPEGKQVAWLNAEWVVRDPKPEDRPGWQWNWNHSEMVWTECRHDESATDGMAWVSVVDPESGMSVGGDWQVIEQPDDGKIYQWDKETQSWVEVVEVEEIEGAFP
jgi:hypothetical protein